MKVSVIVCTYNRHLALAKALESVAACALAETVPWEVVVVDNNSSDRTREVVESFCQLPSRRFRYLFEPRPGKSYALNSGIREAQGDVLVFVDDDVTVEQNWLHNLTAPLLAEEWAGVGGRTLPAGQSELPPWLSLREPYDLGGVLCALFDFGDRPGQLDRPPYGANMAFRRIMFEKYGNFRTDLGPSPNSEIPRPNEDAEFGRRLMAAGERLRYEPSAIVYHPIPKERFTKRYFLDWWFDYGRAMVREWGRGPDIWRVPRPYLSILKIAITEMPPRMIRWLAALDPKRRFFCKCWVWTAFGEIEEFWSLARNKTTNQAATALQKAPDALFGSGHVPKQQ